MVSSFRSALDQPSKRSEVEVEVLVLDLERLLEFVHSLLQQHEGLAQALDLIRGERAAVYPAQRLALHQLAQPLDQQKNQRRQVLLEVLAIGVAASPQGAVESLELVTDRRKVGIAGEQLAAP